MEVDLRRKELWALETAHTEGLPMHLLGMGGWEGEEP